jgi:hypothetical protein
MKETITDINIFPKNLFGKCFKNHKLCLICQNKVEEYLVEPVNLWDTLPNECQMAGWFFLEREKIKQKIRKKKEKVLSLQIKLNNSSGIKAKRILKDIEKYKKEINTYKEQGSDSW